MRCAQPLRWTRLGSAFGSRRLLVRGTIVGKKTTKAATREQQRLFAIVGIGFDGTEEDDVIAPVIPVDGSTLKVGNTFGQQRRIAESRRPFDASEFFFRRFGEFARECLLRCAQHVYGEVAGVLEDAQA